MEYSSTIKENQYKIFKHSFADIVEIMKDDHDKDINIFKDIVQRHEIIGRYNGIEEFVWSKHVKYIENDNDVKNMIRVRKLFCKEFKRIVTHFCYPFCQANDYGSTGINSDIDITLQYGNMYELVLFIQRLARELFNTSKNNVVNTLNNLFDINFYTSAWYTLCPSNDSKNGFKLDLTEKCISNSVIPTETMANINIRQISWGFLKYILYKYPGLINPVEIEDKYKIVSKSEDMVKLKQDIIIGIFRNIFVQINKNTSTYYILLDFNNLLKNEMLNTMNLTSQVILNKLNIEKQEIMSKIGDIEETEPVQAYLTNIKDLFNITSKIAYYEDDSYYTYGAFKHSVLKNQRNINNLVLSNIEILCGYLENAGMFLQKINTKKQYKYFQRCLDITNDPSLNEYNLLFKNFKNLQFADTITEKTLLEKTLQIIEKTIAKNTEIEISDIKHYFNINIITLVTFI